MDVATVPVHPDGSDTRLLACWRCTEREVRECSVSTENNRDDSSDRGPADPDRLGSVVDDIEEDIAEERKSASDGTPETEPERTASDVAKGQEPPD